MATSDNKVLALKRLLAAIKGDGTAADSIGGDTVIDVIDKITAHFNGEDTGELGTLTLTSLPGTTVGTTKITANGAESTNFRYAIGSSMPAYLADLSGWITWDGKSDITVDDGATICVCEVDSEYRAIAGGTVTVNANLG